MTDIASDYYRDRSLEFKPGVADRLLFGKLIDDNLEVIEHDLKTMPIQTGYRWIACNLLTEYFELYK